MIHSAAHEDVNLIWGVAFDDDLEDEMRVTVIATNFDHESGYSIPNYTFKSKDSKKEEEKKAQEEDDDKDYFDILEMFKNRNM